MRKFVAISLVLVGILGFRGVLNAQEALDTILVNNPSFEQSAFGVPGWTDCGFINETPFDAQPNQFGCTKKPADGSGYVGMVVRDNETYEAIAQRLTKPLERGKCYGFSLKLARSTEYLSHSHVTGNLAHYTTPARIRIWGGNNPCSRMEMLAETGVVVNLAWKTYYFKLQPIRNYQYIVIEAFYKTPTLFPYNGNVIVDDMSNIYEMKCDDTVKDVVAAVEKKPHPTPKPVIHPPKVEKPKPEVKKPKPVVHTPPTKKTIMPELNQKVKKGQRLRIRNLSFAANSAEIPSECNGVLNELYHFLLENPSVKIELGGYTNNRCDQDYCEKLSKKRAKAVADWLINKGISSDRVTYKGYGKANPIATNATQSGRKKNQRVEVKFM